MTNYIWGTGFRSGTIDVIPAADRILPPGSAWIDISSTRNTGSWGLNIGHNASFLLRAIDGLSEAFISLWYHPGAGNSTIRIFAVGNGNNVSIRLDSGYWDAYIGDTKVADGTIFAPITWNSIQLRVLIANSGGIIQTRINGRDDVSYVGDTQASGTRACVQT